MPEVREQVEIFSGYGGFAVRGDEVEPPVGEHLESALVEVVKVAEEYEVFVKAASQYGPYDVVTEHLSSPPPPATQDWEDVVELSLRSGSPLVVMEIDDTDPLAWVTPGAGDFRLGSAPVAVRRGSCPNGLPMTRTASRPSSTSSSSRGRRHWPDTSWFA